MMLQMNLREAVRSLVASKQRTILALIGIIIGIASVITMVSVGTIVRHEALRQFVELGTDIIRLTDFAPSDNQPGRSFTRMAGIALKKASPDLAAIAPITMDFGCLKFRNSQLNVSILGATPELASICKLRPAAGRFLTPLDENMQNCVLGAKVAADLTKAGLTNPIGKQVMILNNLFTVVGVLQEASSSEMRPNETNSSVIVPYGTLVAINHKDQVANLFARLIENGLVSRVSVQIKGFFQQTFPGLVPSIRTAEEIITQMNRQMDMFTLLLGVIGSISLIVGGVGVMNVMLVSVTERRREIGIRRAIGAQQSDIRWQFLLEAVLLCTVGGVFGIVIGVVGSYLIAQYSQWEFMVSWVAIILGGGVSITVGLFFGLYPAIQASRLKPIEALRSS